MARGINLSFLSDVRQLLRGTDQVQDALSDVAHSLDQVAQDSSTAEASMTADFKAIADQANASAKSVGDGYDTASKRAGDSTGKIKEGFKGTGDELKQEGLSGAAAFDGSMESAADSAQAFSSVALASFGPLGAALGVAAAAGFGALRAQAQRAKEQIDKTFDALVDGQGRLNDAFQQNQLSEWAKDGTLAKLAKQAEDLGLSYEVAVRAALGQSQAIDQVRSATEAHTASLRDNEAALVRGGIQAGAQTQKVTALQRTSEGAAETIAKASDEYDLYADAVKGAGVETKETTDALDDNVKSLEDVRQAALEARGEIRAVEQAYDDAKRAAKDNGKTLDETTQKGRDNAQALDDLASAIEADGSVTDDEVRKWERVAEAMGLTKQAADDLARSIGLIPDGKQIKVDVVLSETSIRNARNKLAANGYRFDDT